MILVNTLECACPNIKIYFEKVTIKCIKKLAQSKDYASFT